MRASARQAQIAALRIHRRRRDEYARQIADEVVAREWVPAALIKDYEGARVRVEVLEAVLLANSADAGRIPPLERV